MLNFKKWSLLILSVFIIGICQVSAMEYAEYEVVNIAFTNNLGELRNDMQAGQSIYIAASVTKIGSISSSPFIIISVYSPSGSLYKSFFSKHSGMLSGQTLTISPSFTLPDGFNDYYVKVYVFDSLSGPSPLANTAQKYITNEENTTPIPSSEDPAEEPPLPAAHKQYRIRGSIDATSNSDSKIQIGQASIRMDYVAANVNGTPTWVNPGSNYTDILYSGYGPYYITVKTGNISNIDNYLDLNCEFILSYNDYYMVYTITSISVLPTNQTVTFKSEDISDSRTTDYKLAVYTDKENDKYANYDLDIRKVYINGRTQTIEPTGNIWKGEAITEYNAREVFAYYANSEKEVDIKLLCNTSAGDVYNIAYITSYIDVVVDTIMAGSYAVLTSSNTYSKVILDEENSDYRFSIYKDGNKISFADIKENDVLSIAGYINDSKELEYGKVIVNSTTVTGRITLFDSVNKIIFVDNTKYMINNEVLVKFDYNEIRLGDLVTFAINARGILCGVLSVNDFFNFSFATTLTAKSLRVLNRNGIWENLMLNSNIKFNGGEYESLYSADLPSKIKNINNTGTATVLSPEKYLVNKMVAYKLNSDYYIEEIYFVPDLNDYTKPFTANEFSNLLTYLQNANTLGSINLKNDTILYSLSAEINNSNPIDENEIIVGNIYDLEDNSTYAARAYNLDTDMLAGVILGNNLFIEQEPVPVSFDSSFMVVSDKFSTTNAYGEVGYNFQGVCENQDISIFASVNASVYKATGYSGGSSEPNLDSSNTYNISKGDIILYSTTPQGEISQIYIIADASDIVTIDYGFMYPSYGKANVFGTDSMYLYNFQSGSTNYDFVFGYAKELSSTRLTLIDNATAGDTTAQNFTLRSSNAKMSYYDAFYGSGSRAGRVMAADAGDITFDRIGEGDGDYIFMRVSGGSTVEDLVIYKAYN